VALEGRIESRRYTASDGTPRKSWECKGERLAVLTWPKDEEAPATEAEEVEPEERRSDATERRQALSSEEDGAAGTGRAERSAQEDRERAGRRR
jgi:single-stranded DNA-binding protein